tara:strand:- start:6 stop:359 length:354 start_codon:yes stop_codon:yes gene_type:complete
MNLTQDKTEFLVDCLLETLNNRERVDAIESSRTVYTQFEYEVGRKYIKVWSRLISECFGLVEPYNGRSCYMFVEKDGGACYKPASHKAPAKGIRFWIDQLADNPDICDAFGSFLYIR